jgi:hypothetical protein
MRNSIPRISVDTERRPRPRFRIGDRVRVKKSQDPGLMACLGSESPALVCDACPVDEFGTFRIHNMVKDGDRIKIYAEKCNGFLWFSIDDIEMVKR